MSAFVPTPPQDRFIRSSTSEAWFFGEIGAGKTTAIVQSLAAYVECSPNGRGVLLAATYPLLHAATLPALMNLFDFALCDRPTRAVKFRNGFTLDLRTFRACRRNELMGGPWSVAAVDGIDVSELDVLPPLRSRLRVGGSPRLLVAVNLTPAITVEITRTGENRHIPGWFVREMREAAARPPSPPRESP